MDILDLMARDNPTGLRLTPRGLARLERLAGIVGRSRSEVAELAITHSLSTVLRDHPLWVTLPGEPDEPQAGADAIAE